MTQLSSAGFLAARREPFRAGNLYGEWVGPECYVVYSYGEHWPLAMWTPLGGWVANRTKHPQPTTTRHAALLARHLPEPMTWLATDTLRLLLKHESFTGQRDLFDTTLTELV